MSGTRHHFIPQFLLRGFASHSVGSETYAWVYRKNRSPFNPNVINIGVEGHFYTHEGNSEVDDSITAIEGDLASTVNALRRRGNTEDVSNEELARLFAHLEVRTRHLRENFEQIGNTMLSRIIAFISDEVAFGAFILRQFERDPNAVLAPLAEELRARGIQEHLLPEAIELVRPRLPALLPSLIQPLMGKFSHAMQLVSKRRPQLLQSVARSAQLRALRETIAPEMKIARYSGLRYQVLQASERSLPLGDSVVFAQIDAPREYTTFVGSDDRLLALYLPLSPSAVLCGHSPDFSPSLNELPLAIARCSLEYFVGHDHSPHLEQYQTRISELAEVLDDESVERLLMEALDE